MKIYHSELTQKGLSLIRQYHQFDKIISAPKDDYHALLKLIKKGDLSIAQDFPQTGDESLEKLVTLTISKNLELIKKAINKSGLFDGFYSKPEPEPPM